MKILVPTDFSVFADAALDAAILFAQKLNGELHLYHSANIPDDWEDLKADIRYQDAENKEVAIKVRNKFEKLKQKVEAEGVKCAYHYTGGKFIENITEITDKIDFDLIIMGSHGASGNQEWIIGSNTQKVVRLLHKNVLVLKDSLRNLSFTDVLFVTGLEPEDKQAFWKFLKFMEPFNVKNIHVMTVNTNGFFTPPSEKAEKRLSEFKKISKEGNVQTHFYPDYTIDAGVRHFTEEFGIDLVAISNYVRHPFKRIFIGSNVEMLVNRLNAPVLTIDWVKQK